MRNRRSVGDAARVHPLDESQIQVGPILDTSKLSLVAAPSVA
jgi:hypothetical protein